MRKAKIMLIAPYKGLIYMFEEIASKRDDIELTCFEGDTNTASDMIARLPFDNYDIIVSRGHTCTLLQKTCHRHIIDIGVSVYDLLCSIRMAQNYIGKFAVVGFDNIIHNAYILSELMQYQTEIVTLHNTDEIPSILKALKEKGYSLIVGDVVTVQAAQDFGFQTILITSSPGNISNTLDACVSWFKEQENFQQTFLIYQQILQHCQENVLILSDKQEVILHHEKDAAMDISQIKTIFSRYVQIALEQKEIQFTKTINGQNTTVRAYSQAELPNTVIFYYRELPSLLSSSGCIRFYDITTVPKERKEYSYLLQNSLNAILSMIKTSYSPARPIAIEGPDGSGRDDLAFLIYQNSTLKNSSLIIIDCRFAASKEYKYFLTNENSPLFSNHQTIYFKNLHYLKQPEQIVLYSLLSQSKVTLYNHLIFSYDINHSTQFNNSSLLNEILNNQHALSTNTPDLNKHLDKLSSFLTWYLNDFNSKMSKQVIAFSSEAIEVMKNFTYTGHFKQLQRIVYSLLSEATSPYISKNAVEAILKQEQHKQNIKENSVAPLDGTLEQITKNIMYSVLKQENMNQSKAAKRLGISRSTLRRKLGL